MASVPDADIDEPTEAPSTSAIAVYRLRFVPFSPSAPTALALSSETIGSTGRGLLAIGRKNGDIDLCTWVSGFYGSYEKAWMPHTTLVASGKVPRKIESLAFAITSGDDHNSSVLRLFSIGGGSNITEHFLPQEFASSAVSNSSAASKTASTGLPVASRALPSYGGVIWCMAVSPLSRYIAIGCEDGHIRLVDIRFGRFEHLSLTKVERANDGSREAVPRTDKAKFRLVSLAWGPPSKRFRTPKPSEALVRAEDRVARDSDSESDSESSDDDEDVWSESFILVGTSASVALIYLLSTGRIFQRLLLPKARREQTIVWSTAVLPDGTLVTGDSLGFVTFYDSKTKVPLTDGRFQAHEKGADVLCLSVGSDGKTLYSGSVDQKISEYTLISKKWVHTTTRRLHAHDVKSLVIDPPPSIVGLTQQDLATVVPILISASTDFNVVLTPASPPSEVTLRRQRQAYPGKREKERVAFVPDLANPVSSNEITSFASTTQRRMPYVPCSSSGSSLAGSGSGEVQLCPEKGWVALRSAAALEIWLVQCPDPLSADIVNLPQPLEDFNKNAPFRKLLSMQMTKRQSKLIAHSISPNGGLLAVSDLSETKLYSLRLFQGELQPRRVKPFSALFGAEGAPAASALTFTPDGRIIFASWPGSVVYLVSLGDDRCQIVKAWSASKAVSGQRAVAGRKVAMNGNAGGKQRVGQNSESDEDSDDSEIEEASTWDKQANVGTIRIDLLVISSDLQYLLCGSGNRLWTYNLDLLSPHPRLLPSLRSRATDVAPHPRNPSIAVVALQDGSVRLLDLEDNSLEGSSKWSHLIAGVNAKIAGIRDPPIGLCWLASGDIFVVHGATWLLTAKAQDAANGTVTPVINGSTSHKRSRRSSSEAGEIATSCDSSGRSKPGLPFWAVRVTFRYQPLVRVGRLNPSGQSMDTATELSAGLAVIERPFFDLAKSLDAAWKRERRYGQ